MKRILSFIICVALLASFASILTACDDGTVTTTTTTENTSITTENTSTTTENTSITTEVSTTGNSTTTTETTTENNTTSSTTKTQSGGTTTKNQTPVSTSPFDTKKCVLMRVRNWEDGAYRGTLLQYVKNSAGEMGGTIGDTVYVEFGQGTKIYYDDGRQPITHTPTQGYFATGTWLLVAVDSAPYGLSGIKSTAVKVLTTWEDRLTLTMRYIENDPYIRTTYTKTDIDESYCKKIMSYECDGDFVYVLLSPGRLVEINSKTGLITKDAPLSPEPYEMRIYGNEIWVSFGSDRVIGVLDKSTFDVIRVINVPKTIFSFDVYNDYLFYADTYNWGVIYRYNMVTGENVMVYNRKIHQPEIVVNKQANCVYVAETDSSKAEIYAFDFETLEVLHSASEAHSGVPNIEIYNGMVYWSYYRLDAAKLSTKKKYMEVDFKGVFSVTSKYIAASDGIYDRSSLKLVNNMYNDTDSLTVITKSGNIVVWRDGAIHVVTKI